MTSQKKVFATLDLEKSLWINGFELVCGLDEVGRGCFAGPVVVGAVVFPANVDLPKGIADSKMLTAKQRQALVSQIKQTALYWSIAEIGVALINKMGIGKATQTGFRKALKLLPQDPEFVLIDAFFIKHLNSSKQKAVKNGDTLSASIAAASIIAKVYRDELMTKLSPKYPEFGFAKNKGYGTLEHRQAIAKFGLCDLHRKSFNLDKFLT